MGRVVFRHPLRPPPPSIPLLDQESGTLYYEVNILSADASCICQFGVAGTKFALYTDYSNEGVGDDTTSWAVDGMRQKLWHKGHMSQASSWGGAWRPGDVIGISVDLDQGTMSASVNGSFAPPNGAAFDCVRPGPKVGSAVYPALSANSGIVEVNFGLDPERPLLFAPLLGRRNSLQVRE